MPRSMVRVRCNLTLMAVALMSCNSYVAPHVGLTADLGGLPRFSRVVELEEIPGPSANVSAGDLDGDGDLDIVLAKGRHWPQVNRVLMGDGTGQFTAGHDLGPVADRSYSGFLSDLDGDGDLDVIIGNDRPDTKRTYLSDGSGHFEPGSEYGQPEWPTRNASVADLNGDGLPDVVVANRGRPNSVCLNQGHARFSADCTAFSKESATTITPADLDGDGRTDLVVPNRDGGQSYVYLNDGAGGFSNDRRIPFGEIDVKFRMAAVADLDGDDLLDIVAIDERRGVSIYLRASDNGFMSAVEIRREVMPYALAVEDLNSDDKVDVIVGHIRAASTVYYNDGTGRNFASVDFGDDAGTAYGFAFGDFDQDSQQDIAVARSGATSVVYLGDRE